MIRRLCRDGEGLNIGFGPWQHAEGYERGSRIEEVILAFSFTTTTFSSSFRPSIGLRKEKNSFAVRDPHARRFKSRGAEQGQKKPG